MKKCLILILLLMGALQLQAESGGDISRLKQLGFDLPEEPVTPPPLVAYRGESPVQLTRQNRVTILYFWSTLIPSSLTDLSLLDTLNADLNGQEILFAPVNLNESRTLVLQTAETLQLTMEMFCYPERASLTPYILKSVPSAYILDSRGMLVASIQGNAPWGDPDVKRSLEELTGESH